MSQKCKKTIVDLQTKDFTFLSHKLTHTLLYLERQMLLFCCSKVHSCPSGVAFESELFLFWISLVQVLSWWLPSELFTSDHKGSMLITPARHLQRTPSLSFIFGTNYLLILLTQRKLSLVYIVYILTVCVWLRCLIFIGSQWK